MIHDPILVFTILAFVIMATPLVAERLRVPDLVLLLLAGAVLGPNCSGLLERGEAIRLFGSVGLLYIMFIAGLEVDLHRFAQSRNRSVAFGLLLFTTLLGVGFLVGSYALGMTTTTALLFACMFPPFTLLAYPIASRLGISKSEPVAVVVGGVIIADVLALLVLTVVADSSKGIVLGMWFWIKIASGMAGLLAFTGWGLPWLGNRFFRNVPEKGGAQFLFVLAIMCGCAYMSHFASVEPIIGAFLAGVAFNRLISEQSALMNRVHFVGHTLFIPFFLISIGMLVDFKVFLGSGRAWIVVACMVLPIVLGKWAVVWVIGKLFGYDRDEVKVMFGLSVVHAAATLAVVMVGYERLKIFDSTVLNGTIALIFVSCPLGAWMVDRYGRRMAARALGQAIRPRGEQRLLVPVANPESAAKLLDLAFLLRDNSMPGAIQPVTIITESGDTASAVAEGEQLLARCLSQAAALDMPLSPGVRVGLNASDGIIRAVKELRSDSVLLGWRDERSAASRVFGTILDNLLDECPARIVLCRLPRPLNTTRRLFLALPPMADRRSDIAMLIRNARWLAKQVGASLRVLLCDPSSASKLRAMVDSARPSVPTSYHESIGWGELRSQLFADIRPDDMAILPVERRHGALWSPNLNRLPDTLSERFPDMNLLAVYPGMASVEDEAVAVQDDERPDSPDLHAVDGDDADIETALQRMAKRVAPCSPEQQAEVLALLEGSARGYPMELTPGVVFLHAHSDVVSKITLLVWHGSAGLAFPGCSTPAQTILVLISPSDRPPELHLKALADLARRFHDPKVAESVRAASSVADVCRAMKLRS